MAIQRKKTGKSAKKATRGKASKGAGAIDEADLKRELIHSLASYLLGFASRSAAGESYVVGPIEMGRLDDRSRLAVDFSYRVTPDGRLALVDRMPLDTYMQSKSSEIWHHGGARAEAQLSDRTSATSPAPDAERHVSLPLLANLSTRRHYPGSHVVEAQLNGEVRALGSFTLVAR